MILSLVDVGREVDGSAVGMVGRRLGFRRRRARRGRERRRLIRPDRERLGRGGRVEPLVPPMARAQWWRVLRRWDPEELAPLIEDREALIQVLMHVHDGAGIAEPFRAGWELQDL